MHEFLYSVAKFVWLCRVRFFVWKYTKFWLLFFTVYIHKYSGLPKYAQLRKLLHLKINSDVFIKFSAITNMSLKSYLYLLPKSIFKIRVSFIYTDKIRIYLFKSIFYFKNEFFLKYAYPSENLNFKSTLEQSILVLWKDQQRATL
jgi:hypothetical protein